MKHLIANAISFIVAWNKCYGFLLFPIAFVLKFAVSRFLSVSEGIRLMLEAATCPPRRIGCGNRRKKFIGGFLVVLCVCCFLDFASAAVVKRARRTKKAMEVAKQAKKANEAREARRLAMKASRERAKKRNIAPSNCEHLLGSSLAAGKAMRDFDSRCKQMKHSCCRNCRMAGLLVELNQQGYCKSKCSKSTRIDYLKMGALPTWTDENGKTRYDVPDA